MLVVYADVLGIEQFRIGHDNGGSQDHSRIMLVLRLPSFSTFFRHTHHVEIKRLKTVSG